MTDVTIGSTNITQLLRTKYKQMKKTGWVTLVQVPAEKHLVINTEALKILVNEMGYQCIYITLGKTCIELDKLYKKNGVETTKLYFIDAISKMYGESKENSKRFIYTTGPLDVDSITSSLRDLLASLGEEKKCVFLDSVTTVLLYNSLPRTVRFSQFLTQTLKKMGVTGIMVSIAKGQSTDRLVTELGKLCDEVISVTTGKGTGGGGNGKKINEK
jgi:KaiC/GvpD/RAD55 family RecA-like ATPase